MLNVVNQKCITCSVKPPKKKIKISRAPNQNFHLNNYHREREFVGRKNQTDATLLKNKPGNSEMQNSELREDYGGILVRFPRLSKAYRDYTRLSQQSPPEFSLH